MKLIEIVKLSPLPEGIFMLPDELLSINKMFGKSEGREVYGSSFTFDGEELFVFFNKDDHGFTAYVILREIKKFGREFAILKRTWTRPGLRSKGYLSGLIRFINQHLKISLVSDDAQTPTAVQLWKNLKNKFDVKVINFKTGKISKRNKVSDTSIYGKNLSHVRLFLEAEEFTIEAGHKIFRRKQIKEWVDNPILQPYHYYSDGDV